MNAFVCACVYVCTYVRTCVCVYVRVNVCSWVHACVHIFFFFFTILFLFAGAKRGRVEGGINKKQKNKKTKNPFQLFTIQRKKIKIMPDSSVFLSIVPELITTH